MRDWSAPAPGSSGALQFLTRPPSGAWSGHVDSGASFRGIVGNILKDPGCVTLGLHGLLIRPVNVGLCPTRLIARMYQWTARFVEFAICATRGVKSSRDSARHPYRSSRRANGDDGRPI